jgi:hypothetical protein
VKENIMRTLSRTTLVATLVAFGVACGGDVKPLQNQPPVAQLTCPSHGEVGVPLTIDGTASKDVDGAIAAYEISGPDEPIAKDKATVTPSAPGVLAITLVVTDDKGGTGTAQCRIPVDGEPVDPFNPPTEGEDEPSEGEDEPAEGEGEDDPIDDPIDDEEPEAFDGRVAHAKSYSVDCDADPFGWATEWHDDEMEERDEAENLVGFAWWACGHDTVLAEGDVIGDEDGAGLLRAESMSGQLASLPGMATAAGRNAYYMIQYTTVVTPPAGADSVVVTAEGEDVVAALVAMSGGCGEASDDTDTCPVAVADREWATDMWGDAFIPEAQSLSIDGPTRFEIRVANYEGSMGWNVRFDFYDAGGTLLGPGSFRAP